MKQLSLLKTELRKQKRGYIWLVVMGIPICITGAIFLDMHFRYDSYLYNIAQKNGMTSWEMLLIENQKALGWGIFLPLFIAVIATIIHYTEFEENSWKQLLTLPISRSGVYISKFITILFFSFIMIALKTIGLILVGKIIGFPEPINYQLYSSYILYQYVAILGVASIHNFLSIHSSSMIKPVVIGFLGIIATPAIITTNPSIGKLIPYAYTYNLDGIRESVPSIVIYGGIISMFIITILGIISFNKRDIA